MLSMGARYDLSRLAPKGFAKKAWGCGCVGAEDGASLRHGAPGAQRS